MLNKIRKKKINKIEDLLNHSSIDDRRHIFNLIAQNFGPKFNGFYEEGTGIRILYDNMSNNLLDEIIENLEINNDKYKLKF